ncbi:Trimethylguanosine synthase [Actinomortierella wolfii]|nr:Trimethylguanosine synthase [Actinomortierella wolfii]
MVKSRAKRRELAQLGRIKNAHHKSTASNESVQQPTTIAAHSSRKERRKEKKLAKKARRLLEAQSRALLGNNDDDDDEEPPQLVPIEQPIVEPIVATSSKKKKKNKKRAAMKTQDQVNGACKPIHGSAAENDEEEDERIESHGGPDEAESGAKVDEDDRPEEYPLLFRPVDIEINAAGDTISRMQGYQPAMSKSNKRSASEASLTDNETDSTILPTTDEISGMTQSAAVPPGNGSDNTEWDDAEGTEEGHVSKKIRTLEPSAASIAYQTQQSQHSTAARRVRYTKASQLPADMAKYWYQRYRYFSLYDEGIHMDKEGWYSVTPEKIASHIAERCACDVIIDAFCGVGGNAIQFALTCHRVIAIDIDPVRLECAKHNARIYGVEDRIEFILGDYMTLIPRLKADVVFLSPPWGGPKYSERAFDIKQDIPMDGEHLFRETQKITPHIAYYLPRNSDPEQIGRLAGEGQTCEINKNVLNGACKAWTVYFGELQMPQGEDTEESNYNWTKDEGGHWDADLATAGEDEEEEYGGWDMKAVTPVTNGSGGSKKKNKNKNK